MRNILRRLGERLRAWWHLEDPEERIEGSGQVVLDPAYNGRYTAERRLQDLAEAGEDGDDAAPGHVDPPHLDR